MVMAQYCPHTGSCPFYKNWVEQTKDRRMDVITLGIVDTAKGILSYDCLTLIAIKYPKTGIPIGERLKERVLDIETADCSHLTLLNRLNTL